MRAFRIPACLAALLGALTLNADDRRDDHGPDRERHGPARVTFYEHADFSGASFTLGPGETIQNLDRVRFSNGVPANDRISSIQIDGDLTVLVYRDARFRGGVLRLTHDVRNFAASERDWNDTISSLRIERGGRPPSPGRPDRDDWSRFDKIIDRAYRDLLQRPPDESGLRSYRTRMIEDNWSDQDVRESIRRSPEFKIVAERIVAKAYRDLLGRDPDEGGGRMFRDRILRDRWTEEDVRNAIRNSPEYRNRPHH